MQEIESFLKDRMIAKKPLATQISQLLFWGPIEEQSVQKYTPHNQMTQRRYTPRE
jgi:hypothetical protein